MAIVLGNLRYSIQVITKSITKDEYGAEKIVWSNKIKLRADRRFITGDKTIDNKEVFNSQRLVFTTLYRSNIIESDRIVFDGKTYSINSISELGYKEGLQIDVELINE